MTHPGVDPLTALAYVLIIGTPTRFQPGKQIGTYVSMIPCEESSARKQRLGHISKQGKARLSGIWIISEQGPKRIGPAAGIPILGLDALGSAAYGPPATVATRPGTV
jgi:transposase